MKGDFKRTQIRLLLGGIDGGNAPDGSRYKPKFRGGSKTGEGRERIRLLLDKGLSLMHKKGRAWTQGM